MSRPVHSSSSTTLRVAGLPSGVTKGELQELFRGYSTLEDVNILAASGGKVAKVTFGAACDASDAQREKDGMLFRGSVIFVARYFGATSAGDVVAGRAFSDAVRKGLGASEARSLIEEASRGGHSVAAAWARLKGIGVTREPAAAYATLRELAATDHTAAALQGVCLVEGDGVEANELEGVTLLEKAVACRDKYGAYKLAMWLSRMPASAGQSMRVVALLEGCAKYGMVDAQVKLGDCLWWGCGVKKDEERAGKLWEEAAEGGCGEAQLRLGHCERNGFAVKAGLATRSAERSMISAGELEHLRRCFGWGEWDPRVNLIDPAKDPPFYVPHAYRDSTYVLRGGRECHLQYPACVKRLREAAETSHAPSIYVAGLCYRRGWCEFGRDKVRAAQLFARGCAQGSADCMFELGRMLLLGEAGVCDHYFGLQMLSEAVARGSVEAEDLLGLLTRGIEDGWEWDCLVGGTGVDGEATEWKELRRLRLLTDEDVDMGPFDEDHLDSLSAEVLYEVGWAYWSGRFYNSRRFNDFEPRSEDWFWERAAGGGSLNAKVCLARSRVSYTGRHHPHDLVGGAREAIKLLRDAAAGGSMAARGALQTAYWVSDQVEDVPKDIVREMAAGGAVHVQAQHRKLFDQFAGEGLHWMAEALAATPSSCAVGGGASAAPPGDKQASSFDAGAEVGLACAAGWRAFQGTTGGGGWLKGLRLWLAAAEAGDAASAAAAGVCYELGICVSPDATAARRYYERAAGGGDLSASVRLAAGAVTNASSTHACPEEVEGDAFRRGGDAVRVMYVRGVWNMMLWKRYGREECADFAATYFLAAALTGHSASQLMCALLCLTSPSALTPSLDSVRRCGEDRWLWKAGPERVVAYCEEQVAAGKAEYLHPLSLCRIAGRGCEADAVEGVALALLSGCDVPAVEPCVLRAGQVLAVELVGRGFFSSGAIDDEVGEVVVPLFPKTAARTLVPFVPPATYSLGRVLKAKERVLRILRSGVERDAADGDSTALLVAAVLYDHAGILSLLLDWGLGSHCECDSLHAAVGHAVRLKRVSAFEVFVRKGWRVGQDGGMLAVSVESGDEDVVACVAGTLTLDEVTKSLVEASCAVSAEEYISLRASVEEGREGVKEHAALLRLRGVVHHAHWEAEVWRALDDSEGCLDALRATMQALEQQQDCGDVDAGGGAGVDHDAEFMREKRDEARRMFVAAGEGLLRACDGDLGGRLEQRRDQFRECISAVGELEVDGLGCDDGDDGDGEDDVLCESTYTRCHEAVKALVDELLQLSEGWKRDAKARVKERWEECRGAAATLGRVMASGTGGTGGREDGAAAMVPTDVCAVAAWRRACGVAAVRCRVTYQRYCADLEAVRAELMPVAVLVELRRGVGRLKRRLVQLTRAAGEWGERLSRVCGAVEDHKPWAGVSDPCLIAELETMVGELEEAKQSLDVMKAKRRYRRGADVPSDDEVLAQRAVVVRLGDAVRRMSTDAVYLITMHYPELRRLLKPGNVLGDVYASGRLMTRATLDDFEEVRTLSVAGRSGRNTVRVMKRSGARLGAGGGGGGSGGASGGSSEVVVVVKEISGGGRGDDGRLEFARSVRHLWNARHRCVADVRSCFEDGGNGYIEMPYYEGGDLEGWMKEAQRGPLVLRRVAHEVAQGLAHLHRLGIVHRDVKPTNVLLDSHKDDARAVLADFDTAITSDVALSATIMSRRTMVGGGTVAGGAVGTLVYMAPELFEAVLPAGVAQSPALDVFSFGVTLLMMGNGGVVPDRPNGKDAPPIPAGVDCSLAALVTKLMAVNAAERPTMAEVLLDSYFVSGGGAADLRDCCICGARDGFDVRFEGAVCDGDGAHACCQGCVEHFVDCLCAVENLDTAVHKVVGGGAALQCFAGARSCGGKVSMKQLARVLSRLYYDKVERLREHAMDSKMAIEVEKRVAEEKARLEREGEVGRYARHIQDTILTLLCPHCDCAFFDFTGCLALSHPCGEGGVSRWFCGLCLDRCGEGSNQSAHAHVKSCPHNPSGNFFDENSVWEKVQQERKQRLVRKYLAGIPPHYVEAVKAKVKPSATAIGVVIDG